MEKEVVEKTVEYQLEPYAEKSYNEIRAFMKKPIKAQRFLFHKELIVKHYSARVIVEKEDRVSVADASFGLSMGMHGPYIRRTGKQTGVTYHKTGRSSSRFKVWSGVNKQDGSRFRLLVELTKKVRPEALDLINDQVVSSIGTDGMFGYILSGNIENTTEAMEYYIRYSLRGLGIKQDKALLLYELFKSLKNNWFSVIQALRCAKDPNQLIHESQSYRVSKMLGLHASHLSSLAVQVSEKIDWVNPEFDPEAEGEKLTTQSRRIAELLELWEGGPILHTKATQSSPLLSNPVMDDLPF